MRFPIVENLIYLYALRRIAEDNIGIIKDYLKYLSEILGNNVVEGKTTGQNTSITGSSTSHKDKEHNNMILSNMNSVN